jgi:hypothetical protein
MWLPCDRLLFWMPIAQALYVAGRHGQTAVA